MGKQLPDDWINGKKTTLNVFSDLGLKCDVTNLYIYKNKGGVEVARGSAANRGNEGDLRPC